MIKGKETKLSFNAIIIITNNVIAEDVIDRVSDALSLYLSKTTCELIGNSSLFCHVYIIFVCITAFFLAI